MKRGNAEGSVYQRASDHRWVAALTLPDGRRKSYYGSTRAEAAQRLAVGLRQVQAGYPSLANEPPWASF